MRAALLALALAGPAAAQDRCVVACDVVTTGAEAVARAEAALGVALPLGATVVGLVEGGFQDAFVQARIDLPDEALDAVLKRLGTSRDLVNAFADGDLGPPGPTCWEEAQAREPWFAPVTVPGFAHANLGVARGEASEWTLLVWAFQT